MIKTVVSQNQSFKVGCLKLGLCLSYGDLDEVMEINGVKIVSTIMKILRV